MKKFKIKSYCKINLFLKVLGKVKNDYHRISTLVTFCKIFDLISIKKTRKKIDTIVFTGQFKRGIKRDKNTVKLVLKKLRKLKLLKNTFFLITVKKNIPHGSGLGGGSSNAASLLIFLNSKFKLKLNKKKIRKIAREIGFDVPIYLDNRNTFLTGEKDQFLRLKKNFKLNVLVVYPNIVCSTKKIYQNNKNKSLKKTKLPFAYNKKKLIKFLKNEKNDLEDTVVKIYPKVGRLISFLKSVKGCHFSRITGSGSACIGIFSNLKNTIYAQKMVRSKYPNYWTSVSKTI